MNLYFWETSSLSKRYLSMDGSGWVRRQVQRKNDHLHVISELTILEITAIFVSRYREGYLSPDAFQQVQAAFLWHTRRDYSIVYLDRKLIRRARRLVVKHRLRAAESIQIASAITVNIALATMPVFVSVDTQLLRVAQAEGFPVDNPNLHP